MIVSKLPARFRPPRRSAPSPRDQTPERGGAARRARRRRQRGRPRGRAPHVAAPLRPTDPAARLAAAAARRRVGPRSSPATATSGAPGSSRSSPAGGARCAGARGRRAGRTARSTTSSCGPGPASWCRQRGAPRRRLRPPAGAGNTAPVLTAVPTRGRSVPGGGVKKLVTRLTTLAGKPPHWACSQHAPRRRRRRRSRSCRR